MAKSLKPELKKPLAKPFLVVGIGASAGGLDAYKRFLRAIPDNSGMAYILVQHLDPTHQSRLPEILSNHTSLPVHEITDNIQLAPDHIYIIPSNKLLLAKDGVLKLSPRPSKEIKNLPINLFFTSLADVHQNYAVGVVLSGTGTDGTLGLKAIKEKAGITFAQELTSAAFDGMPQSAIDAGVVDFILTPENIPKHLVEMNLPQVLKHLELAEADTLPPHEEEIYNQILSMLRTRSQVDFTYYKKSTIKRRIARRIVISKVDQSSTYLDYLKNNKGELDLLFQDVLIPVTAFFRDTSAFESLKSKIFSVVTNGKTNIDPVRIWVAACSTGEEAYSIAISLCEFLGDGASRIKIQVFATDILEKAIVTARRGMYTKGQLEGVSDTRLKQFFTKIDSYYQVNKTVRDMVVFATHNMLKDPPFAKMDLISCRNVLIYMEPFLQKKVFATFHYSLNNKGFLLLGKSETTGVLSDLFSPFDKQQKIFSKKDNPGRYVQPVGERKRTNFKEENTISLKMEGQRHDFQKSADEILLQEYTPAGVVVNEQLDIVHFRGNTGSYLTPSPGKPSYNLLKMARGGLSFELRNAIHKAKANKSTVIKEGILMQGHEAEKLVTIKVIFLPKTVEPYYLVLFQDSLQPATKRRKLETGKQISDTKDIRIEQLERELIQTREDMRAITEEQEAANEELQSANEELLSGSEELQSVNEELETTKEELQSGNEELTIVNQELTERNEIISDARKYSDVIIATIFEPLVVLNKDMYIRTANKSFYKTFQVNEMETEGKLLYELGNNQWDIPALRTLLNNILPTKKEVTDFEMTHVFPDIGERTMLLNAIEIHLENDKEKLILLAIDDITERKKTWQRLIENENKFRVMSDSSPQIMWTARPDGYLDFYNKQWYEFTGFEEDYGDQSWIPILHPEDVERSYETFYHSIKTGEPYQIEYRFKDRKNPGAFRWFLGKALPVKDDENRIIKWVGICIDIHEQKTLAEEKFLLEFAEDFARYKSDKEFFNSLVSYIARKTGMDYAFIGELTEKKKDTFSIRTLSLAHHGKLVPNIEYPLPTGPCEEVISSPIFTYPKECLQLFPKSESSGELKIEGYISQPLFDRNGNAIGVITVMHKEAISNFEYVLALLKIIAGRAEFEMERNKFNDRLRENNVRLENINRELAQYAYVASHDLQEPLRKIITFSNLITEQSKNSTDAVITSNLVKIAASAIRMKQLIQDLLNYSSIEKPGDSFIKTDLNESLQNVLNDFDLLIEEKGATIKNGGLPVIEAVPLQMNQLIQNLISNSLKFSRPDVKPIINITYRNLTTDEVSNKPQLNHALSYCEIIFKDNGMGFSQDYAEKVFVIFHRLNEPQEFPGTGIGLALCKKIVEYHGGEIFAEGKVNEGAAFHIILPLKQANQPGRQIVGNSIFVI